jgi:hypothetical protein
MSLCDRDAIAVLGRAGQLRPKRVSMAPAASAMA